MTDAANLARRFLALWEDYLTALFSDPSQSELLQAWLDAASAVFREREPSEPAAGEKDRQPGPPAGAAAATGASDGRDDALAEFARRIAVLEERVAAFERGGQATARPRRRNRRVRER